MILPLEGGSPPISQFFRTPPVSLYFRSVPARSNSRMFPPAVLRARGGVARLGQAHPATFTCLGARELTARCLSGCSMTYGNARPVLRLMVSALAPALAHGP